MGVPLGKLPQQLINGGVPSSLWAAPFPGQVVMGYLRKLVRQEPERGSQLCLNSCSGVPQWWIMT